MFKQYSKQDENVDELDTTRRVSENTRGDGPERCGLSKSKPTFASIQALILGGRFYRIININKTKRLNRSLKRGQGGKQDLPHIPLLVR
jgi:hypothetical protein